MEQNIQDILKELDELKQRLILCPRPFETGYWMPAVGVYRGDPHETVDLQVNCLDVQFRHYDTYTLKMPVYRCPLCCRHDRQSSGSIESFIIEREGSTPCHLEMPFRFTLEDCIHELAAVFSKIREHGMHGKAFREQFPRWVIHPSVCDEEEIARIRRDVVIGAMPQSLIPYKPPPPPDYSRLDHAVSQHQEPKGRPMRRPTRRRNTPDL